MKRVWNRVLMVFMACLMVVTSFSVYPVQPAAAEASEYKSAVQVTPGTVQAGDSVTINTVISGTVTRNLLVDVEIFDANGKQVKQKIFDNQSFTAGEPLELSFDWVTPSTLANGTYTVSVGICAAGWGSGWYDWHAGAAFFNVGDVAPPAFDFHATAAVTPAAPQIGDTVQVAATVQSSAAATGIVAVSLLDSTNAEAYKQEFADQTFAAGASKSFNLQWAIPASALSGAYAVKVEVLKGDRSETLYRHASVAQFNVSVPDIVTEPSNVRSRATVSVADIEVGNPQTITAEITSDTEGLALVDLVVLNPSGDMVLQKVVDNVNLEAGVTKQLPFVWTPPVASEPGDYKVEIGVFGPNWGELYDWNINAGTFHVNIGPVPQVTHNSTVSKSALTIGDTVDVQTELTFSESLPADVNISVYDPAGNKVAGQTLDNEPFMQGETKQYLSTWTVPEGALNGAYSLVVSVYNQDGIRLWFRESKTPFTVSGGIDLEYNMDVTTTPEQVMAGQKLNATVNLTASIKSTVSVKADFVDLLTGEVVYSKVVPEQLLQAGVTTPVSLAWDLPKFIYTNETNFVLDGDYGVNVELYSPDLSVLLHKEEQAGTFEVVSPEIVPAPQPAEPSKLPDSFSLGVAADRDTYGITGWMTDTGLPWNFAYHYLNGGVNTPDSWKKWERWSAGDFDGSYAYDYAKRATDRGYIPVFDYYQMLQSYLPECGTSCDENVKDLKSLNNPKLMRSYFEDFKLLMQLMGTGTYNGRQGIGKTVIVHVDPDLAGYAQQAVLDNNRCFGFCTGQGNNPSYLKAAVHTTRMPELDGLPNTYQGYNWALLRLRDLYAPNVILAPHVNSWGTLQDVGSSTDPTLDVVALGHLAAEFANQNGVRDVPAGVKPYDVIFNDVADRDAEYIPRYWWDRYNVTFPNFHRWEEFISTVSENTNKKVLLWQVPLGNQYFRTMTIPKHDESGNLNPAKKNHYMDNKIEYFFDNIDELIDSGIVGIMFGYGEVQQTAQFDYAKDGVVNGPEIETNLGGSSGTIRIWRESTSSDDDGGYLRMRAAEYFQNPILLP